MPGDPFQQQERGVNAIRLIEDATNSTQQFLSNAIVEPIMIEEEYFLGKQDARVSQSIIFNELDHYASFSNNLAPMETLIIYSHSHGVKNHFLPDNPWGGLMLDAPPRNRKLLPNRGVTLWPQYAEKLIAVEAKTVIVLVMSCFSGGFIDYLSEIEEQWRNRTDEGRNFVVLTSQNNALPSNPSLINGELINPFTYAVEQAMLGKADGYGSGTKDNSITLQEWIEFILFTTSSSDRRAFPQVIGSYDPDEVLFHFLDADHPPPPKDPHLYESFLDIQYITPSPNPYRHSLDIYTPDSKGNYPVLVWVHGGSWSSGNKSEIVSNIFDIPKIYCNAGFVMVSINYRLSPEVQFPVHPQDVASSIAWTKQHISDYGGDPSLISLLGFSAGAHLVSLIGTDESYLNKVGMELIDIQCVIPNDAGTYDFPGIIEIWKKAGMPIPKNFIDVFTDDPENWKNASPYHHISINKKIPPMFFIYSRGMDLKLINEVFKSETLKIVKKLNEHGYEAIAYSAQDKIHAQIPRAMNDPEDHLTIAILHFLLRMNP